VIINHKFTRPKVRQDKSIRYEKAMELLRGDDLQSDEELGFSKRQKLQELGMKLLNTYMEDSEPEEE